MHGAGTLSRLAVAAMLVVGLAACDLPGAHPGDAAVVNGHAIPRARWDHLVQVTTRQLGSRVPLDVNSDAGKSQVRKLQAQSLQALVREEVIEELARERNIVVSSADVDQEVARLAQSLGGQAEVNRRLDQAGESLDDLRHIIRINLLQSRMKKASTSYQADFDKALSRAQVTAYVTPCDGDHSWPQCAGGKR